MQADDSSDHAIHLMRRTTLAERSTALTYKQVLHGDNGRRSRQPHGACIALVAGCKAVALTPSGQ
jgi:hypothetical protein